MADVRFDPRSLLFCNVFRAALVYSVDVGEMPIWPWWLEWQLVLEEVESGDLVLLFSRTLNSCLFWNAFPRILNPAWLRIMGALVNIVLF